MPSTDGEPPLRDAGSESVPKPAAHAEAEEAMLYCPVCNQQLVARHCKLVCERCGYFMSCADYY
jgi:hypothetical protein